MLCKIRLVDVVAQKQKKNSILIHHFLDFHLRKKRGYVHEVHAWNYLCLSLHNH